MAILANTDLEQGWEKFERGLGGGDKMSMGSGFTCKHKDLFGHVASSVPAKHFAIWAYLGMQSGEPLKLAQDPRTGGLFYFIPCLLPAASPEGQSLPSKKRQL